MSDASLRINRYLSQAGLGSRRAVEALVLAGRVRVDGETVRDLSFRVPREDALVEVDGRRVEAVQRGRVLLFHKPLGVVSSFARQDQRPCLLDVLPASVREGRLFHVGRLDHDSSGLLLLTDDGDLGQGLLHPRRPVFKSYEVVTAPILSEQALTRLADGTLMLDGRQLAPGRVERMSARTGAFRLEIREGRNRQIRRMIELVGARVIALHRTRFGPLELGKLASGDFRWASPAEITALRQSAGLDAGSDD